MGRIHPEKSGGRILRLGPGTSIQVTENQQDIVIPGISRKIAVLQRSNIRSQVETQGIEPCFVQQHHFPVGVTAERPCREGEIERFPGT